MCDWKQQASSFLSVLVKDKSLSELVALKSVSEASFSQTIDIEKLCFAPPLAGFQLIF